MTAQHPVLWGLAAGFTMSLMLGTVFFSLLQVSINQGYRHGIAIAAGVIVCDLLFLVMALGFSEAVAAFYQKNQVTMAWIGCLALVILGLMQLLRKPPHARMDGSRKQLSYLQCVVRGFLLNLVNPGNLIIWIVALNNPLTVGLSLSQKIQFSAAGLIAIFLTETGISYAAHQLRRWATPAYLHKLDLWVGFVFILAGLRMAWTNLF
jgi:threonine/homoserine/homoserine lactone efflux protein